MTSRRDVLRTVGAAGGVLFAGPATAHEASGEQLDVRQTQTAVVTVDRQLTEAVQGPPESVRNQRAFVEGGDETVYVSETDGKPGFDPHGELVVADTADRLVSTESGGRVSVTDGRQSFHTPNGGVTGRVDAAVAVEATERPETGVAVVGDGVSATVAPGEAETVAVQTALSRPTGRETVTVRLTVEHHGVRELVAHPTAKLVPEDHRLGRLASRAHTQVRRDGPLSFDRSTFDVRYDERGFFTHEEVDTRIGSPDQPVSTSNDTTALILGTNQYGGSPTDGRDAFENVFNSDTNATVDVNADSGIDLGSPGDFDAAWNEVKNNARVADELNSYDCVMVVDDRSLSGPSGRAYVGTAGGDFAFGYCESEDLGTVVHECGHVYGCSHAGSTTHWRRFGFLRHDVMGYRGVDPDCRGDSPGFLRDRSYRACTADRIDSYVDDEL